MHDSDRDRNLAERAAHDPRDRYRVLERLVDHLDDLLSRDLRESLDDGTVLVRAVKAPRELWLRFWLRLSTLASSVVFAEHLTHEEDAALDARAVELIKEVWVGMRDQLRQIPNFYILDGDGSIAAIAEAAHGTAGVLFMNADACRKKRGDLAPAGALAAVGGAARLLLAGQALEAARLATLARDIFQVWATADAAAAPPPAPEATR